MFVGREDELKELNNRYNSNKFECIIIWGRRRVGKTELISKFCENKKAIFFTGIEASDEINFQNFSNSASRTLLNAEVLFENWEKAFSFIGEKANNERILLIMDEYPYVAEANRTISSLLQKFIDHEVKDSKLFIILCGSSMGFMENQVLGYKSPLYGRRTGQIKVEPFDFFDSSKFFKGYSNLEKALAYGMLGGTPQYLKQFSDGFSIEENIINQLLNKNSYLFEEPTNLIKQELREPILYNSIIQGIASGNVRMSDIASFVGIATSTANIYLKTLMQIGIVKKEVPLDKRLKKKSIYKLNDNLFKFWYRYIPKNISRIQSKLGDSIYKNEIEPDLSTYMGEIFEDISKQYLIRKNGTKELPFIFSEIGSWWGTSPISKTQEEIDIIARDDNNIIFGECKWRNKEIGTDILIKLIDRSKVLNADNKYFYIFSKSGFTNELKDYCKKDRRVYLIEFADMFK